MVIANEYLDALPVHRVIRLGGELRELYVAWRNERFTEVAGPISDERVARWFADAGVTLAEGQRAEANLAMLDWIDELTRDVEHGYAIVIDYGAGGGEFFHRRVAFRCAEQVQDLSQRRQSPAVVLCW